MLTTVKCYSQTLVNETVLFSARPTAHCAAERLRIVEVHLESGTSLMAVLQEAIGLVIASTEAEPSVCCD